jgi:hypothetical protein
VFTSKQAYDSLIGQRQASAAYQWIWKSCCQGKVKVFFWLLLNDRLNIRNLLQRKQFHISSVNYVLWNHEWWNSEASLLRMWVCSILLGNSSYCLGPLFASHRNDWTTKEAVSFRLLHGGNYDGCMGDLDSQKQYHFQQCIDVFGVMETWV